MQSEQPSSPIRAEHLSGFVTMLGHGIAGSVQVFLRSGYGDRALGFPHALAAVFLFLYPLVWPPRELASIWALCLLYAIVLNVRRLGVLRRRLASVGAEVHTRYDGRSCLHRLFPRARVVGQAVRGASCGDGRRVPRR